jgi:hypothetical protein
VLDARRGPEGADDRLETETPRVPVG